MTAILLETESGKRIVHTDIGGVEQDFAIDDLGGATPTTVSETGLKAIATASLTSTTFEHDEFQAAKDMIEMQQRGIQAIAKKLNIKSLAEQTQENTTNQPPASGFPLFEAFTRWVDENRSREELDLGADPDDQKSRLFCLPPQLGRLSNLTLLNLSGNSLRFLPPELAHLEALRELRLAHNPLQSFPTLTTLTSLEELDLDDTQLTELPSLEFLPHLKSISFRNNFLAGEPDWFQARPDIRHDLEGSVGLHAQPMSPEW